MAQFPGPIIVLKKVGIAWWHEQIDSAAHQIESCGEKNRHNASD